MTGKEFLLDFGLIPVNVKNNHSTDAKSTDMKEGRGMSEWSREENNENWRPKGLVFLARMLAANPSERSRVIKADLQNLLRYFGQEARNYY